MRIIVLLCCVFSCVISLAADSSAQSDEADPHSIAVVKNALVMRSGKTKVIRSWSQKALSPLGDSVSVALIKILRDEDLSNP